MPFHSPKKRKKARQRKARQRHRRCFESTLTAESLEARVLLDASRALLTQAWQQAPVSQADYPQSLPAWMPQQTALPTSGIVASSFRRGIVFIDPAVDRQESLLADLRVSRPGVLREVIEIRAETDGLPQLADALAGRNHIDAIHIISHSDSARLNLGAKMLTLDSIRAVHAGVLTSIGETLSDAADILIYGCNFGGSDIALLYDSAGDDESVSRHTSSVLRGDGFENRAYRFERLRAIADAGGVDRAVLFDSALDDEFVSRQAYAILRTADNSHSNMVSGFEHVDARGGSGGNDVAIFLEAQSGDHLLGRNDYAKLNGLRNTMAFRFDRVIARTDENQSASSDINNVDYLFSLFGNGS